MSHHEDCGMYSCICQILRERDALRENNAALVAALRQIETYERTYHHLTAEAAADMKACEDCAVARERKWPPSLTCDHHYGVLDDLRKRNDNEYNGQHVHMRAIAREALAAMEEATHERS